MRKDKNQEPLKNRNKIRSTKIYYTHWSKIICTNNEILVKLFGNFHERPLGARRKRLNVSLKGPHVISCRSKVPCTHFFFCRIPCTHKHTLYDIHFHWIYVHFSLLRLMVIDWLPLLKKKSVVQPIVCYQSNNHLKQTVWKTKL